MPNANATESRTSWSTSLGLMAGLRADDAAAWERFAALYAPLLDHWSAADRVPAAEWPDLRQDVFLAVVKALPAYRHAPATGTFRGWLRVIARRKWVDRCRARFPAADSARLAAVPAPTPAEATAEQDLLFKRALDLVQTDFNPDTWRAFWRVVVDGETVADAAAALGLTPNAVYLAKGRVLRRLREEFADLLDDAPPAANDQ